MVEEECLSLRISTSLAKDWRLRTDWTRNWFHSVTQTNFYNNETEFFSWTFVIGFLVGNVLKNLVTYSTVLKYSPLRKKDGRRPFPLLVAWRLVAWFNSYCKEERNHFPPPRLKSFTVQKLPHYYPHHLWLQASFFVVWDQAAGGLLLFTAADNGNSKLLVNHTARPRNWRSGTHLHSHQNLLPFSPGPGSV